MSYKCPLCGSTLTAAHYHRVLKIQEKTERAQKGELERLRNQAAAAKAAAAVSKRKEREARAKAKTDAESARKEAVDKERRKNAVRDKRLMARIKKLEEEKKMLEKRTSPQELGLADEVSLVAKLKSEFPEDRIEHVGKGGDVLHYANFGKEESGCIVYECKRTERIESSHIEQTALAKKSRGAAYAILVTTGTRKKFSGLDQERGVFVVAPSGVLTLARLCRESLITMAEQRLDNFAKVAAAKRLMDFVTSPVCKTPLEEAISEAERAHGNLVREMKQHASDWKERHRIYQTINCDVTHIQKNIARVLANEEPLKLEKPAFEPLALPIK